MLFIFDFDSTLVKLEGIPWDSGVKEEVLRYGRSEGIKLDEKMHIVPLSNLVGNTPERKKRVDAIFRKYERECIRSKKYFVYPSTIPVLSALREQGHKVAIASNNNAISIKEVVEAGGIPVDAIRGRDSVSRPKPHPDMLISLMEEFGVSRNETIMTGDGFWDREAGEAAGVRTFIIKPGALDISLYSPVV